MPNLVPRVFLSYSHDSPAHEGQVLALANRLRADGVAAEIDRYEEAPPDGWPLWMRRQVDNSDFVVCICTEIYKRRIAGDEEPGVGLGARWEGHFVRQAIYEAGAQNEKFIPVLLEGASASDIPHELRATTYYRVTSDDGYLRLYRRLTDQPEIERPALGERRELPPRTVSAARWFSVPFARNPFFVGRDNLLAILRAPLGTRTDHALVGMAGVGKTQLALEHAFAIRDERRAVLWTSAVSSSDIESGFAAFARELALVGSADSPERAVEATTRWLAGNDDWLLVFDNVEDTTEICEWLPSPDAVGQVLLTTRHAGLATERGVVDLAVEPLTAEETVQYLVRRLGREHSAELVAAGERLHAQLGGLPLALAQAAAYLSEVDMPARIYIDELERSRLDLLDRGRAGPGYSETVATTFQVSVAKLRERSAAAADVLALTVGLAPEPVPVELLIDGRTHLGEALSTVLARAGEDPMAVWDLLSPLRELSLATVDPDLETLTVHRLVTDAVKAEMCEEDIATWEGRAVRALNESFPVANYLNWPLCDRFLPHARRAASYMEQHDLSWEDGGYLLNESASYLRMRGEYEAAERIHLEGIAVAERRWGEDDPHVATNYNNISFVYGDQFDFDRAIEWMRRAIRATGHSGTWDTVALERANLAGLYFYAGRLDDAESTINQAWETVEPHVDVEPVLRAHVLTLMSMVEAERGHGDRAEQLALETVRLRRPYDNDEYCARSDIALGKARYAKGDLAGALASLDQAVARRERVYGKAHSLVVYPLQVRGEIRAALSDAHGAAEDATRATNIRNALRQS
jgi:tetratricopeptide (TPR) repeat protein